VWPFKKLNKSEIFKKRLQGRKRIKIDGMYFVIKKINPFLDFSSENIPQIFTDYLSKRPIDPNKQPSMEEIRRIQDDMKRVIEIGVIDPRLQPVGKDEDRGREPGLTVEDIFRDPFLGYKLYTEILFHSLNIYSGLKGLFFSIKIKYWLLMHWRRDIESSRQLSFSAQKIYQ